MGACLCTVQVNQLYCTSQSTVLYKSINCTVQVNQLYCTSQSTVLYKSINCTVQVNQLYCTSQSTVLYKSVNCTVQVNQFCASLSCQVKSSTGHRHALKGEVEQCLCKISLCLGKLFSLGTLFLVWVHCF